MLIDTHCHLDMLDYQKLHTSYKNVIEKAKENGVNHIIHISCYPEAFDKYYPILKDNPEVSFTVGLHPLYVKEHIQELEKVKEIIYNPENKIIALGEMGLDCHYDNNLEAQLVAFEYQMSLAQETKLPVIIHTRDAKIETLEVLEKFPGVLGVIHCYTQDLEFAQRILSLGYYIGVGGVMTFKNATELREVLNIIPMDRILLETDAPYMSPVPYRGKENQPAYIKDLAKFVAAQKGVSFDEVSVITSQNAIDLFALKI